MASDQWTEKDDAQANWALGAGGIIIGLVVLFVLYLVYIKK